MDEIGNILTETDRWRLSSSPPMLRKCIHELRRLTLSDLRHWTIKIVPSEVFLSRPSPALPILSSCPLSNAGALLVLAPQFYSPFVMASPAVL